MSNHTKLGPGTATISVATTPLDFSVECKGAKILHNYEEIGEAATYLDGHTHSANEIRNDAFGASVDNDLQAAGLYAYLQTHDLEEADLVYTPNTAEGAKWEGTVKLKLPDEIGADEFGAPIASEIEWPGVGVFTFTAGVATP